MEKKFIAGAQAGGHRQQQECAEECSPGAAAHTETQRQEKSEGKSSCCRPPTSATIAHMFQPGGDAGDGDCGRAGSRPPAVLDYQSWQWNYGTFCNLLQLCILNVHQAASWLSLSWMLQ
jgi:hypothetical protein